MFMYTYVRVYVFLFLLPYAHALQQSPLIPSFFLRRGECSKEYRYLCSAAAELTLQMHVYMLHIFFQNGISNS